MSGAFTAVEPVAGGKRWAFAAGGLVKGAAAIGSDGNIYFGASDGMVYALSPQGGLFWARSTLGFPAGGGLTIDGKGAVIAPSECGPNTGCGVTAIFTGATGLAATGWPKFGFDLANSGRKH